MIAEATLLALGEWGFRYARWRGWPIAEAEDIRQEMILDYLEHGGQQTMTLRHRYLGAVYRLRRPWWVSRRAPMPQRAHYLPPTEEQLDASTYLRMLSKAEAQIVRRWLTGYEPTDVRKENYAARRRAWTRGRIMVRLREMAEQKI